MAKFWPQTPCDIHGGEPVVYTKTGLRGCCAQRTAVQDYNTAVQNGEPVSPSEAMLKGYDYYWGPQEHQTCGHSGKHTLRGACYFCKSVKSPRQIALESGQTWYDPGPDDPCPKGHIAPRRVATGGCKICSEEQARTRRIQNQTPTEALMKDFPEIILSREDARASGFLTYRTGTPCRNGHTGFRYVSTGNCLDCRK